MLESFRRGQRWLTGLFIAVIGGVFVFFLGLGGPLQSGGPSGAFVVQLDDMGVDQIDFERIREVQEQRMRDSLGDNFDARTAEAFLDQQTLRAVVEQVILAHSARELGLHVTKQEVQRYLREAPEFRDQDGRFDQDLIVNYIERRYGSQRAFLETIEREFLVQKIVSILFGQAAVSESEIRASVVSELEEVSIAFVSFDTRQLPPGEVLDDESVAAYRAKYEDALRADFELRKAEFDEPERVRARHLLIKTALAADEAALEEARNAAQAARDRIVAGESFVDVATELSQDDGTRELGGDLGLVSRSEISLALGDVAFDLEVGAISEVVKTERGFHLVTIEEKTEGGQRSFEDVVDELALSAATGQRALTRAQELTATIAEAVGGGSSLEDAARAEQLTLVRTAPLRRRPDGFIPDIGSAQEVMATAFSLEPGASSPRVFEVGTKLVMISLTSRQTPSDAEIEAQLDTRRDQLIASKRNEAVRRWIDSEQERLNEAGRLRIDSSLVIGS